MIRRLLLLGAMCAAFSATSSASIFLQPTSGPTSIGGGLYSYSYTATLLGGFTLETSDYFTLYDIFQLPTAGVGSPVFTPDAGLPGGTTFSVTTQLLGMTPLKTTPDDSPAFENITVQLTSGDLTTPNAGTDLVLGVLTFAAGTNIEIPGDFTSQTLNKRLTTLDLQIGSLSLPTPAPEPGSLALLGGGLMGLVFGARRRKK